MTGQKQQISIYKIEKNKKLSDIEKDILSHSYKKQKLTKPTIDGFSLSLFYKDFDRTPPWKNFIKPITDSKEDILKIDKSTSENFVLLLFMKSTNAIYAISGGNGYNVIKDHIKNDFGMEIISRLEKMDDRNLKSTREISLAGGILGVSKFFRQDSTLYENQEFGSIIQELKATVDRDLLSNSFDIDKKKIKSGTSCVAKSSFKITKSLDINELIKVLMGCEKLLKSDANIKINNVEKLNNSKHKTLISDLKNSLIDDLWDRYNNFNYFIDFDLCHCDKFEEYLVADYYIVTKKGAVKGERTDKNIFKGDYKFEILNDIDILFKKIKSDLNIVDKNKFISLMDKIKISSYDSEGVLLSEGSLSKHLIGDVSIKNKPQKYFCIDRQWYLIENDFILDLEKSCQSIISENIYQDNLKPWDSNKTTEGAYNLEYIGLKNTLVLDTLTPDGVELCDILRWDDNNIYLIHVKSGFTNKMRELSNQIVVAAKRLNQDINGKAPKSYLKKIYNKMKNRKGDIGNQALNISENDFLNLFDNKKRSIVFVLAVSDTSSKKRSFKNIKDFNSTIAKFSLNNLARDMRILDKKLQITQIENPTVNKTTKKAA